jgi:hypothetical protein
MHTAHRVKKKKIFRNLFSCKASIKCRYKIKLISAQDYLFVMMFTASTQRHMDKVLF